MLSQALVVDKKYAGKYVAMESFTDNRVVAWGKNLITVAKTAKKRGVTEAVLLFIPESGMTHIY